MKPFHWISLYSELYYNLNEHDWDTVNHAATFTPNDTWSWTVGERYLRTGAFYGTNVGTGLIYSSLFFKFSPNWAARALHYYDTRENLMQRQTYTIYRDFRSWTAALTFRLQQNSTGPEDFTVAFTFSLKAQPRSGLGTDTARPYSLLGS